MKIPLWMTILSFMPSFTAAAMAVYRSDWESCPAIWGVAILLFYAAIPKPLPSYYLQNHRRNNTTK
jgi:uncharacterized membrane protein